jgi:hypothetical protein
VTGGPLSLTAKLSTARRELHVTPEVGDLTYTSVDPGGYGTASVALHRPLNLQPAELGAFGRLFVYDARSAETVWEGRVEDLGRTASTDGQIYSIGAVGMMAHAKDRTSPVIYVDTDPNSWIKYVDLTHATLEVSEDDGFDPGLVQRMPLGASVLAGKKTSALYKKLTYNGQKLARIAADHDGYTSTANFGFALAMQSDGSVNFVVPLTANLSTVAARSVGVITTHWSSGQTEVLLEFYNSSGATQTISNNPLDNWVSWRNIVVRSTLFDQDGNEITAAANYTHDYVLASEIVADMLGRTLAAYDGANARIDTTSYQIEQLAYPDGVSCDKNLEDLLLLEPAYTWHVWETNDVTGLNKFEWRALPTSVRYEAGVEDGADFPSSAADVYDIVYSRYKGGHGFARTSRRTQTVQMLVDWGHSRSAFVDLGDNVGTAGNADRAGDQFLADHAAPANSGRLTIARPIVDFTSGRWIQPWQIRPGELIRVRGLQPYVDALNRSTRDGYSVFKIVSVEYSTSTGSAVLELDRYTPTVARALAELARQRAITRRR